MAQSISDWQAQQNARLFTQRAQPATEARPGLEQRGNFRRIVQGDMPAGLQPPNKPLLDEQDRARAALLIQQFAALIQNTNITASQPAHNEPNLWSTPVDLSGQIVVPAAAGPYQPVLSYQAQPGRWVRVTGYGVDVISPAAYTYDGSLQWCIKKNGIYVETLGDWGEHRGSVIRPRETFILLNGDDGQSNMGGDRITFEVRRAVAAVLPATVHMALTGYTWRPRNNYEGTRAGTTAY
jgi:hypothetical protein